VLIVSVRYFSHFSAHTGYEALGDNFVVSGGSTIFSRGRGATEKKNNMLLFL